METKTESPSVTNVLTLYMSLTSLVSRSIFITRGGGEDGDKDQQSSSSAETQIIVFKYYFFEGGAMKWRTIGLMLGLSLCVCIPALADVVMVAPPNGTDDTAVIQAALNACVAHGPGCTVQLAAGTYLTKQLFAKDFYGTFKGRGMDVTIIQALPNLEVSQEVPIWASPPSVDNKYPTLITFFGGDVHVSDMTIRELEINPFETGWYDFEGQTEPFPWMWSILEFMGDFMMDVVVTRVAVEGMYDESQPAWDHYNSSAGIEVDPYPPLEVAFPGYLSGTFRFSACRIETVAQGIAAAVLHEARLIIGGSPSEANLIQNCEFGAWYIALDSSTVDSSYNEVSVVGPYGYGGFVAFQSWPHPVETPSSFLIHHNRIKATGGYEDGIWLIDFGTVFGEGKTADFVISHNNITIEPSAGIPAYAGIQSDFTEGTIFSNNKIVGRGLFGIALEGDTQAMVKANNVQQVVADVAPIGLMINLWYDPDFVLPTTDCTVVGFGAKTNVYDEGVNNTIVGVNNKRGNPPGPAVRDAMKRKMELIKSMRKH
jgi:hypothetical protein